MLCNTVQAAAFASHMPVTTMNRATSPQRLNLQPSPQCPAACHHNDPTGATSPCRRTQQPAVQHHRCVPVDVPEDGSLQANLLGTFLSTCICSLLIRQPLLPPIPQDAVALGGVEQGDMMCDDATTPYAQAGCRGPGGSKVTRYERMQ